MTQAATLPRQGTADAHSVPSPGSRRQVTMAYHSFLVEPISCHAWNKDRTRECSLLLGGLLNWDWLGRTGDNGVSGQ